ncbi:MAG: hydroxymyristoyl-ACP dehydratase [Paludibacter sp.]|nr:hydroxymyristoyl-ACP dehydratase [Bacteroidales bacterium]MCM1068947.1 hydroxymyristoyl-ACP dehydratase [Prevotella sp.]MCM1353610.1 hydroxymyristoyl-ACP dehydratase [Bacteroides sp.]MCM1442041.1 hydroxymyristoyl-ACP dehydratase [Muribaculum sp.]MCM1481503.1 hydroxymyristoyl-ACP dehydratase [Paludibacter sp.]
MDNVLFEGDGICQLIPQRHPIMMVEQFGDATEMGASTALTVRADNLFLKDQRLQEPGLIEHIAQSAAAFAGYGTYRQGLAPRLGYIGEIKKCRISALPMLGDVLNTRLKILGEAAGITLLTAETQVNGEKVAECQMKIFLKEE